MARADELMERGVAALERLADVNQEILTLGQQEDIELEASPPTCPHCGKLNPEVTQLNQEGSGPLGEFAMKAETHCCNRVIWCVPTGLIIFSTHAEMEGRTDGTD